MKFNRVGRERGERGKKMLGHPALERLLAAGRGGGAGWDPTVRWVAGDERAPTQGGTPGWT